MESCALGKEAEPQFPHLYGDDKNSLCTFVVRMDETHYTGTELLVSVSLFFFFSPLIHPCVFFF